MANMKLTACSNFAEPIWKGEFYMRIKLLKITATAALFCLGLALFGISAEAKTVVRMQCVYPETGNAGKMAKLFAEKAAKYTNGEVEVKVFWPNQLVKVKEAYTAVSKGMVDAVYAASLYFGGIVPAVKSEFMPMTWPSPEVAFDLYYKGGYVELLRKANAKKGVRYLGPVYTGSFGFMTNFEVTGLDSLKGKKIRAMSVDAALIKELGASPVAMAGTEMYAAMQRGTIDGIIYPYQALDTYNFYEVTTCVVLPGIHTPAPVDVYFNQKLWKSLSPENQKALDKACKDTCYQSVLASAAYDKLGMDTAKKHNIKIFTFNAADQAKLRAMARKDWKRAAEKSPELKEAVALMEKYLDTAKVK